MGTNVSTNYITCPADANKTLGIKLPVAPHLFLGPPLQRGGAAARVQALPARAEGPDRGGEGGLSPRAPCTRRARVRADRTSGVALG